MVKLLVFYLLLQIDNVDKFFFIQNTHTEAYSRHSIMIVMYKGGSKVTLMNVFMHVFT
jgi:hypothetical protein